ncbi:MAG: M20/M25/M40 family metallo-hydrolase [Rhodobacteraceae bacterium]|nr:M20/M25/M40 family metallo-hydrolase [Paracoccaceae bacterium]
MTDTDALNRVLGRLDAGLDGALDRLMALLRIPSISTDPANAGDCVRAAEHLVADLASFGVAARVFPTTGHPMVVGHLDGPPGAPHLLFYGHYDVQPVDPLELWHHDPFDPRIEETPAGKVIRGRGANDDKGQLMTFVEAVRAWIAEHGAPPVRLTFLFEGEEESGSPSLVPFLREHAAILKADLALVCDTSRFDEDTPAITTRLRGLLGEEVTLHAASRDLHSGGYGGPAANPLRVLARVLAGLHDEAGRVTLPGFYDGVSDLPPELAAQWQGLGFDAAEFLGRVGLSHPAGEAGRSALEMLWARPTCEINGIRGGYTGAGFKTVLPAEAHAKVSFRLVGRQDPLAIREAFRAHVAGALPPDVRATFEGHGASPAVEMETGHPAFEAARAALSDEWPRPAAFIGAGGSIPIAGWFKEHLGLDAMLIGFGRDDDQLHSPNEKYDLKSFHKGMRSWARVLAAIAG